MLSIGGCSKCAQCAKSAPAPIPLRASSTFKATIKPCVTHTFNHTILSALATRSDNSRLGLPSNITSTDGSICHNFQTKNQNPRKDNMKKHKLAGCCAMGLCGPERAKSVRLMNKAHNLQLRGQANKAAEFVKAAKKACERSKPKKVQTFK